MESRWERATSRDDLGTACVPTILFADPRHGDYVRRGSEADRQLGMFPWMRGTKWRECELEYYSRAGM